MNINYQMAVHRALLLAKERRAALSRELVRWKSYNLVNRHQLSTRMLIGDGQLTIRSIVVELNEDFCYRQHRRGMLRNDYYKLITVEICILVLIESLSCV
jgi:hypothetical protein